MGKNLRNPESSFPSTPRLATPRRAAPVGLLECAAATIEAKSTASWQRCLCNGRLDAYFLALPVHSLLAHPLRIRPLFERSLSLLLTTAENPAELFLSKAADDSHAPKFSVFGQACALLVAVFPRRLAAIVVTSAE